MTYLRAHWQIFVLAGLIFALWDTPVIYPLRLLAVFFHEASHGLAALLTGGRIESLTLSAYEGGLAHVRGGSRFLILSAGYLGSLFMGTALFLIALRTGMDRVAVAALGLCTLLITAFFIRDTFPVLFCGIVGVALLLTAWRLPTALNDLVLRIVGLASMIYAPRDIISDTIARSHITSDARMLANEFGGATLMWGILWLAISLAFIALTFRHGLGPASNIRLRPTAKPE